MHFLVSSPHRISWMHGNLLKIMYETVLWLWLTCTIVSCFTSICLVTGFFLALRNANVCKYCDGCHRAPSTMPQKMTRSWNGITADLPQFNMPIMLYNTFTIHRTLHTVLHGCLPIDASVPQFIYTCRTFWLNNVTNLLS